MLNLMNPELPATPPPNLDFIMKSDQTKPKRFMVGGPKARRILTVVLFGIVLFVLIFVFMAIVRSNNRRGLDELVDLAAYQTELIRVVEIAAKDSTSSTVRGSTQTSRLTLISDLNKTKLMISSLGARVAETDLSKYRTGSINKTLKDAKTANNFDEIYTDLFAEKLTSYEEKLATAYLAQNNIKIKNTISIFNAHSEVIGQSSSTTR